MQRYEDQILLIAVPALEDISPKIIGSHTLGPLNDPPFNDPQCLIDLEPGIYVWRGEVTEIDGVVKHRGSIMRSARITDIGRFGMGALIPE